MFPKAGAGDYSSRVGSTITCFYGGCELKVVFTFLNGWKKLKEEFVTCANDAHFPFLRPDKAYMGGQPHAHVHVVSGCFPATLQTRLVAGSPFGQPSLEYSLSGSLQEKFAHPCPPGWTEVAWTLISLSASLPSAIHVRI